MLTYSMGGLPKLHL